MPLTSIKVNVRMGEKRDLPGVLALIKELAVYEKAPKEVTVSLQQLETDGFGSRPLFEFVIAEQEEQIVGMAFYYFRYSTWKGKMLYLEDFIVTEPLRGNGIGKVLFETVMKISLEKQCVGMSWQVLDWNEPAIKFYQKYQANLDASWVNGKLTKEEIESSLSNNQ